MQFDQIIDSAVVTAQTTTIVKFHSALLFADLSNGGAVTSIVHLAASVREFSSLPAEYASPSCDSPHHIEPLASASVPTIGESLTS